MFEWFTEFMESPLGKLISTGILAVAVLLLTLAAAGLVNRLMKKLVDPSPENEQQYCDRLRICALYSGCCGVLCGRPGHRRRDSGASSAVRTLLATGGVTRWLPVFAAQEALGRRGQRRDDPRIQAV